MSRRIDLLRLDYAFSVLVPCLMAIYFNKLNIIPYLDIILGFLLYAITGNTLNDVIDMKDPNEKDTIERVKGYNPKEIMAIAVISFFFGSTLFIRTIQEHPINGLILVIIIGMVVFYCINKHIPIFNQILLGISHIILPYLMIKIDANITGSLLSTGEWFMMITFLSFAVTGQSVHEIIDGDVLTRYSLKAQQKVVIIFSVVTIVLGFAAIYIMDDWYFLPLALIPVGSIYTFRKPTHSSPGVKDVGIVLGNIILVYFLVLILQQSYYLAL